MEHFNLDTSTEWEVDITLRAMYEIFKDSSVGRAKFKEITTTSKFPL